MQSYLNKAQAKSLVLRLANRRKQETHDAQLRKNERLKAEGLQEETWLATKASKAHQYERVSSDVINYLEDVIKKAVLEIASKQRGNKKTIQVPQELC